MKEMWSSYRTGSLSWHSSASRFFGAGISEKNIPFTYGADWQASGRWGIDILTKKNRYILRPMEKLQVTPLGSSSIEDVILSTDLDDKFKPGLYSQCNNFLNHNFTYMCSLHEQILAFPVYSQIAGYSL